MVKIGVDYYPEHWDRSLWLSDLTRMKEAGVKLVRIAEFSWSRLEKTEGVFDFGWLDEIVGLLTEAGFEIILGTPTNCPPLWMYRNYPETLRTEKTGEKTFTGIRGHRCLTNGKFRFFVERIVRKMLARYGGNRAVVAYQIDNELDSNGCRCPDCAEKFRDFLRGKYGDINALNREYGNDVWSGDFSSFEEILPPMGNYDTTWFNPAFMLDYERFKAFSTIDFIKFQRDLIRKVCPGVIVTTNSCFGYDTPDYHKLFSELDVTAYDNYPSLVNRCGAAPSQAFILDKVRGFRNENFWIMEQMSGGFGCWGAMSPQPVPGSIKGCALQAVAHGADVVVHFRWRTSTKGAEMFCHGILDHDNTDNRRFLEFKELSKELDGLDLPCDARVKSPVALLYSYEQEYAFKVQRTADGLDYVKQAEALHGAFFSQGVNVDVIEETADLSGYKVAVVPMHFITNDTTVKNLERFVRSGGTALITFLSGTKDAHNNCKLTPLPCEFTSLCGATVEEYDPVGKIGGTIDLMGAEYPCGIWCDVLKPVTAEAVAVYSSGYYKEKPAVTLNSFGAGKCYYVGTAGEAIYSALAKKILTDNGVETFDLPAGVERCVRENEEKVYEFLFNNSYDAARFVYRGQTFSLKPFGTEILTFEK